MIRPVHERDSTPLRTTDRGTVLPRCVYHDHEARPDRLVRCVLWAHHVGECVYPGEMMRTFGPNFEESGLLDLLPMVRTD